MDCNETEPDCPCSDCTRNRANFETWCNDTENRWARAMWAKRILHQLGDCGPLCPDHGSPLDTSLDVVRLGLDPR